MERAQKLIEALDSVAEVLKEEDGRLSRKQLARVRALLPAQCNDEEIAALALIVHQTERGALIAQGCDLLTLLSRKAPGTPRWDVVLPRLTRKGFIALLNMDLAPEDDEDVDPPALYGHVLRDVQVALLISGDPVDALPGYAHNWEYLEDCFAYIDVLYDTMMQQRPEGRPKRRSVNAGAHNFNPTAELESMRRRIAGLTARSGCAIPLEELRTREKLDERDWQMLLLLLRKDLASDSMEVREFTPFFGNGTRGLYELRKYFGGDGPLISRGFASLGNGSTLMRMDVDLDPEFVDPLLDDVSRAGDGVDNPIVDGCPPEPFASNDEYLETWLTFTGSMYSDTRMPKRRRRRISDVPDRMALEHPEFRNLLRRTAASATDLPLERIIAEQGFGDAERFIILTALHGGLQDHPIDIPDVIKLLAEGVIAAHSLRRLFAPESPLLKSGLITVRITPFGAPDIFMPANMIRRIFASPDHDPEYTYGNGSELFEVREPRHTLDAVKLPHGERTRLDNAMRGLCGESRERLRAWGVSGATAGRPADSLLLLFSGAPGTGKTFAAEALAGSLGRRLLVTDISKILSKWIGESEQNVAALFRDYRELCQGTDAPPVLLLNECDQFLSHRFTETGRGVDRMYNQMQNLFLENLETFPGLLIATTNLTEALDEAFSRRFDEKIVFPRPDNTVRLQLWEAHLPSGVPRSADVDISYLSSAYPFSGGQISLASSNAIRTAAIRGDALRMEDLERACDHELRGSFEKTAVHVGFRI